MNGITIYRDFPIIDSFVQLPPNREQDKNRYTIANVLSGIDGSFIHKLGPTSRTSGRYGSQDMIRVPEQTFSVDV